MAMNSKQRKSKTPQVREKYGSCCRWCGKHLPLTEQTLEHMIPRSMGGKNNLENLRPACRQCNNSRRNNPFPPGYYASWKDIYELALLFINQSNKAHE
jgi:5-methylcytosine-specific restriction endonuclease McrA